MSTLRSEMKSDSCEDNRYELAMKRFKNDRYIQNSPRSSIELIFLNENGHTDKNGNFFFIKLLNGYKTKVKKLDKSIPGKYKGPRDRIFKSQYIIIFSFGFLAIKYIYESLKAFILFLS